MNTNLKLNFKETGDSAIIYVSKEESEIELPEITINTTDKTIKNIKEFFVNLLEQSFLREKKFQLSIGMEEEITSFEPGITEVLNECIVLYENALIEE